MQNSQDVFLRIDNLMKRLKRQQKDMDSYLCLPRGTYSHWAQKKSSSYMYHIGDISKYLGVSPNYLILGTDDWDYNQRMRTVTEEESIFLEGFEKTRVEDREILLAILQVFVKRNEKN